MNHTPATAAHPSPRSVAAPIIVALALCLLTLVALRLYFSSGM